MLCLVVSRGLEAAAPAGRGWGWARRQDAARGQPDAMPASPGQPDSLIPHHVTQQRPPLTWSAAAGPAGGHLSNTGDAAGREGGCQGATRPHRERRARAQDSHHTEVPLVFTGSTHCLESPVQQESSFLISQSVLSVCAGSWPLLGFLCVGPARLPGPAVVRGLSLWRRRRLQGAGSSCCWLREPGPWALEHMPTPGAPA